MQSRRVKRCVISFVRQPGAVQFTETERTVDGGTGVTVQWAESQWGAKGGVLEETTAMAAQQRECTECRQVVHFKKVTVVKFTLRLFYRN